MLPLAVAVNVVIPEVPPIARVPDAGFVSVPPPLSAVETVSVIALLFVYVPLTVRVVNVIPPLAPVICFDVPVKVTPAELAVKVPVLVQSPPTVMSPVPCVMFPLPLRLPVRLTTVLLVLSAVVLPAAQLPATESVPGAVVFVPAPENVRLL